MTKLMQWLFALLIFLAIWASMLRNIFGLKMLEEFMPIVVAMPVLFLGIFGVYAASIVLWRVYTFNDCDDAAKELQKQIVIAKEELTLKGFVFQSPDKKED